MRLYKVQELSPKTTILLEKEMNGYQEHENSDPCEHAASAFGIERCIGKLSYIKMSSILLTSDVYLMKEADEILGMVCISNNSPYTSNENEKYLHSLFVIEKHRGKGIAGKIIGTLENHVLSNCTLYLHVFRTHTSRDSKLIRMYEKLGFSECKSDTNNFMFLKNILK